jgi:NAD(P)-dependent dehydrogenase (short-subunit alcohol dehydrogenase family)
VSGVLDGRSVIVTGGAIGIGLAISRRLTALRASLAVLPHLVTPELAAAIAAGTVPPALEPVLRDAVDLIPIGRAADPEEVAGTVAHLLRPEARFVTGQTISVHGGSSMA